MELIYVSRLIMNINNKSKKKKIIVNVQIEQIRHEDDVQIEYPWGR